MELTTTPPPARPAPGWWFENEIRNGLTKLVQLGKPTAPTDLKERTQAWANQLWEGRRWDNHLDTPRIRRCFHDMGNGLHFFPEPSEFWDYLQPATQALQTPQNPRLGEEKRRERLHQIQALSRGEITLPEPLMDTIRGRAAAGMSPLARDDLESRNTLKRFLGWPEVRTP